jgi:hypothetical protein
MKKMKNVTQKKIENNIITIPAPKQRLRSVNRGKIHQSGKRYSRKEGKSVE